jgi:hypothetical protein
MTDNTEERLVKETSKAYMAGLMDADGTYTITSCIHKTLGHRLYDPTVACVSTHRPTLERAVAVFGGTIYNHKITGTSKLPRYDWLTQTYEHSRNFVSIIRPYILQKQRQADILLDFYSLYRQQCPEKRQQLCNDICSLNAQESLTTNMQDLCWKPNLINAYFAGFFDGESTVGYTNYGTTPRIEIGNTNKSLLVIMQYLYGGRICTLGGKSRPTYRKPMWNWSLCVRTDVEKFLLKMLPYIETKRKKSLSLLNFVRQGKIESDLIGDYESAPMVTLEA